jgi:hypothetical protein
MAFLIKSSADYNARYILALEVYSGKLKEVPQISKGQPAE